MSDLFRTLGPIAIFSAKRHWTAPRLVQLHRARNSDGFGFSVRGDAPVIVAHVESNGLADVGVLIICWRTDELKSKFLFSVWWCKGGGLYCVDK